MQHPAFIIVHILYLLQYTALAGFHNPVCLTFVIYHTIQSNCFVLFLLDLASILGTLVESHPGYTNTFAHSFTPTSKIRVASPPTGMFLGDAKKSMHL